MTRMQSFFYAVVTIIVFASQPALSAADESISLAWHLSNKPVLILGEASHQDPASIGLVKRLLDREWNTIEFIALESDSSEQRLIDSYLNSIAPLPQQLNGAVTRDLSLLSKIKTINQKRMAIGLAPIDVVAMDLPGTGFSSREAWFAARDQFMAKLLQEKSNGFSKKGIILTGAGHAAKFKYRLQSLMRLAMKSIDTITPLGSYEKLRENSLSVFLQTKFSLAEKVPMSLFRDTRFVIKLPKKISVPPGELVDTKSSQFINSEQKLKVTDNTPMRLSQNFDFWLQPVIQPLTCAEIFSH